MPWDWSEEMFKPIVGFVELKKSRLLYCCTHKRNLSCYGENMWLGHSGLTQTFWVRDFDYLLAKTLVLVVSD